MKLLLTAMLLASALVAGAEPFLRLSTRDVDLGSFPVGTMATDTVTAVNSGDETLTIRSITSDCGCTGGSIGSTEIAPGDSARIVVRFDGSGRRPGSFRKVLRIKSNARNFRETIYVQGRLTPAATADSIAAAR